ncbi:MAG: VWA domain-containing protein [Thermoprotei archaeon]
MISDIITRRIVDFCALLRTHGFNVGVSETMDCLNAIKYVDVFKKDEFRQALMCTLVKRADQTQLFLDMFENFFSNSDKPHPQIPSAEDTMGGAHTYQNVIPQLQTNAQNWFAAYSPKHVESNRVFVLEGLKHRGMIKRNIRILEHTLPALAGRRRRRAPRGVLDLKATLRLSLRGSDEIKELRRMEGKPAKNRVVILVDISGSMDSVTPLLLEFLYVASNSSHSVSLFCFSTKLRRVDPLLRGRTLNDALRVIRSQLNIWGSGTRIGECLKSLLTGFKHLLAPSTLMVIISDGWDLGEVSSLLESVAKIRLRVGGILWFNPLADTEGYRPLTLGISAVLPYIDGLFGLSNLLESRGLRRLLTGLRASGGI